MIRMMEIERRSEEKRDFSSFYIHRVAYTMVIDEIRRLRQRRNREMPLSDLLDPPATVDQERSLYGSELGEAIRECLSLMKQDRRRTVTLFLLGHTVPEAAGILGWERKRTENFVFRGKADLRECLASKGLKP